MTAARWAIFSDIHSNLEALQAVLTDISKAGIQRMLCLGDIVGYNANPAECVEVVRRLGCIVLRGNHDTLAASDDMESLQEFNPVARAGILYSREHLGTDTKKWLETLPLTWEETRFGAVHASLFYPEDWHYITTLLAVRAHFAVQDRPVYFHGHTHFPVVYVQNLETKGCSVVRPQPAKVNFKPQERYLINVGAVGQPRDRDPRACYGIIDAEAGTFEFRRVEYDIQQTQKKIIEAGLPEMLAMRLALGA